VLFTAAVLVQIRAKTFHPFLYWLTIVATTTVGTTLADYCTRSLGIGYTGGSTILLICVMASLLIWRWSTGSISIETVNTPKIEVFYWVTIMFSQTLGTALGDWVADTNEMGYLGAAADFGGLLLLTALLYYFTTRDVLASKDVPAAFAPNRNFRDELIRLRLSNGAVQRRRRRR